jgi:Zn-dependent M28 family amino/carboxypeptidase
MIGRIDTERKTGDTLNYIYVVGDDKLSTELKPLSEMVNNKTGKLTLDYKFNDPNDTEQIYFRSDHYNFARKGVPVIFYYDGMLKADYHKPTDTPDKISYQLLEKRARLVFYTAWEMANRENMMKRDLELPKMSRQ